MAAMLVGVTAVTACGDEGGDTPAPAASEPSTEEIVRDRNDQAIDSANQAPDARAAAGEAAIRRTLTRELGMNRDSEFGFPGNLDDNDCYVKTGAEAADFADMDANILYSPAAPGDLVFVQTFQGVPLVKCLRAVKGALDW